MKTIYTDLHLLKPTQTMTLLPPLLLLSLLGVFPALISAASKPPFRLPIRHMSDLSRKPEKPASKQSRPLTTTAPISFCKCTCFDNSTIIPLDAPAEPSSVAAAGKDILSRNLHLSPPLSPDLEIESRNLAPHAPAEDLNPRAADEDRKEYRAGNCKDCNRQFCLGYNLPICKGATEKDVSATCFRECSPRSVFPLL